MNPFSCAYTPSIPKLLKALKCSIVLSTYQAGKVIFISPADDQKLVQLPRNFDKAMGIAFSGNQMAMATKNKIHLLTNSPNLARTYPKSPNKYDAFFLPRKSYYTGEIDLHDIHIGKHAIYATNTSFSCIVKSSDQHSWEPIWKPDTIDNYVSEDRCHLNGMIINDKDEPTFATAFGEGNTPQSWRSNIPGGGVLYNIKENKIINNNLQMPHSPRAYNGKYYLLESAIGALNEFDPISGEMKKIFQHDSFLRGLAFYNDFAFIGKSQLRSSSSTFNKLDIAKDEAKAGILVVRLSDGKLIGEISYQNSVEEIYDVQILAGFTRPNIANPEDELHHQALSIPGATFWAKSLKTKNGS